MAYLTALSPAEVSARVRAGKALLVDIREADEVARERIAGSVATPLSMFEAAHLEIRPGHDVVFMCRSGNRTGANCVRLADRIPGVDAMARGAPLAPEPKQFHPSCVEQDVHILGLAPLTLQIQSFPRAAACRSGARRLPCRPSPASIS